MQVVECKECLPADAHLENLAGEIVSADCCPWLSCGHILVERRSCLWTLLLSLSWPSPRSDCQAHICGKKNVAQLFPSSFLPCVAMSLTSLALLHKSRSNYLASLAYRPAYLSETSNTALLLWYSEHCLKLWNEGYWRQCLFSIDGDIRSERRYLPYIQHADGLLVTMPIANLI